MKGLDSNLLNSRQRFRALTIMYLAIQLPASGYQPYALGSWAASHVLPHGLLPADHSDCDGGTQNFDEPLFSRNVDIPFELRDDFLIVVRGRIGTSNDLDFVVDTGTTHTMIDSNVADRLGVPRQSGTVINFDREVKVGRTTIPEFQVGTLLARNLQIIVAPLKRDSDFTGPVDGVIGLDFLGLSRSLRIDFRKKLLQFRTIDSGEFATAEETRAPVVHLQIQGQRVTLILDTGINNIVLFKDRLRQNLLSLKFAGRVVRTEEGRLKGSVVALPGLRVGLTDLQVPVFLVHKAPRFLPAEVDGFLGARALNSAVVEVNFEADVLHFAEPRHAGFSYSKELHERK